MKNINGILKKLYRTMGETSINNTPPVVDDSVVAPEPDWSIDQITEPTKCCGLSEWDLVEATLCGEAAGCSEVSRQRVWGVIVNRTMPGTPAGGDPAILNRGVCSIGGYGRTVIKPKQFSCWNAVHPGCPNSGKDPFSSCELLKQRVACLKALCGNRPITRGGYTGTSGLDMLKMLGFTDEEAVKVKHYMTLDALLNWRYLCQEAKDLVRQASGGDSDWVGCVSVVCDGKTYKICSDGCHVFISGMN